MHCHFKQFLDKFQPTALRGNKCSEKRDRKIMFKYFHTPFKDLTVNTVNSLTSYSLLCKYLKGHGAVHHSFNKFFFIV
jgi:hypothetical protein